MQTLHHTDVCCHWQGGLFLRLPLAALEMPSVSKWLVSVICSELGPLLYGVWTLRSKNEPHVRPCCFSPQGRGKRDDKNLCGFKGQTLLFYRAACVCVGVSSLKSGKLHHFISSLPKTSVQLRLLFDTHFCVRNVGVKIKAVKMWSPWITALRLSLV